MTRCKKCEAIEVNRRQDVRATLNTPAYNVIRKQVRAEEQCCWLCGGADLRIGESWTVDHVIPRSLGGSDDRHNLRKAHSVCNERRGCKIVTEQLRRELARQREMYNGA